MAADIAAVIFDWGGTLTPWHTIDFDEESRVLARAVVGGDAGTRRHGAARRERRGVEPVP